MGGDVVRLQLFPGRGAVSFWEAWPLYLDKVERDVKEAKKAGLKIVPVLMGAPFTDAELQGKNLWQHPELEERYTRAWKDLATRMSPYKEMIWGMTFLMSLWIGPNFLTPPRMEAVGREDHSIDSKCGSRYVDYLRDRTW